MLNALDKSDGDLVAAHEARLRGIYVCPCCGARVLLSRAATWRGGRSRQAYFFHRPGEGSADCERFVASRSLPSVDKGGVEGRESLPTFASAALRFGVKNGEPAFSLVLPPYESPAGDALVVISGESFHRDVFCQTLENGKTVEIPLRWAPWHLVLRGAIDPDYRQCLDENDLRLAADPILFYAERSAGRRVRASERLTAGDALWILSRNADDLLSRKPADLAVIHQFSGSPWQAVAVILPESDATEAHLACARWLGHEIVPEHPRAFVASPLPTSIDNLGQFQFRTDGEPVVVRVAQPASLQIRCAETDLVQCEIDGATHLEWRDTAPGRYRVLCADRETEAFEVIAAGETQTDSFLSARLDEGAEEEWLHLVARLRDPATPIGSGRLRLTARHPALSKLIKIDGHAVAPIASEESWPADLTRSTVIDAQALGLLNWQPRVVPARRAVEAPGLAKWLQGVASHASDARLMRLRGAAVGEPPTWLATLYRSAWDRRYAPQLRSLEHELIRSGVWNVIEPR